MKHRFGCNNMKNFKDFIKKEINESISLDTKNRTELLVQSVYSKYASHYSKNQPEVVGWMDGSGNALIRNTKIYESGIDSHDSILDVGCGVAHLYYFLENQGWKGDYLGIDPNKKAIDLIESKIPTICGTIEDLKDRTFDWAIASGVFNIGLKEQHTKFTIKKMIESSNKGTIFNMLNHPYGDDNYISYKSEEIVKWLKRFDHRKIELVEGYMKDNAEFTIYFYKV